MKIIITTFYFLLSTMFLSTSAEVILPGGPIKISEASAMNCLAQIKRAYPESNIILYHAEGREGSQYATSVLAVIRLDKEGLHLAIASPRPYYGLKLTIGGADKRGALNELVMPLVADEASPDSIPITNLIGLLFTIKDGENCVLSMTIKNVNQIRKLTMDRSNDGVWSSNVEKLERIDGTIIEGK